MNLILSPDETREALQESILPAVEKRIKILKEMIADHDCKLSPEDGCECVWWKEELAKLTGQPDVIIQ